MWSNDWGPGALPRSTPVRLRGIMPGMEDNPFRESKTADESPSRRTAFSRIFGVLCIAVAVLRACMWLIGTLRMIAVPDRLENLLAVSLLILWPVIAGVAWATTGIAAWRNRWRIALIGIVIASGDLLVLTLVELPIKM